jgi:hypothetical protein
VPLDAELFVASQPISTLFPNPWSELAQPEAGRRFRKRVRQIVLQLRAELKREVRLAERLIRQGRPINEVLLLHDGRISALGCYITALRAGRPDLADRLAGAASAQHRSCPLYRPSSLALIPVEAYPSESLVAEDRSQAAARATQLALSLN